MENQLEEDQQPVTNTTTLETEEEDEDLLIERLLRQAEKNLKTKTRTEDQLMYSTLLATTFIRVELITPVFRQLLQKIKSLIKRRNRILF